ncbi:sacsin N-terminal ATP-binding-like domain-containing protein [Nocardia sp. NPDC060249]|uniref:sacsin N-terminal ATP-binding-like domain-containing protein n=1 Tax=Nocardia sp. NPDC060249 TaxID=3347082 RepID=UPI00364C5EC1
MNGAGDPFGTAQLRAGVLAAWRDSPTRLREDSASEADLVAAGYRDRLFTELAQNAADAAAKAGVAGELIVRVLDGRLHVANTGAPLSVSGVHALTALRASGKAGAAQVGRFGVGFTAVRSVGDEIEVRSTTGSLRFSRVATLNALHDTGIGIPDDLTTIAPPVLRLAWPVPTTPLTGTDTEIVVHLRDDIDPEALLDSMRAEAPDLLLELPALQRIRIETDRFTSAVTILAAQDQPLEAIRSGATRPTAAAATTIADAVSAPDASDGGDADATTAADGSIVVDEFGASEFGVSVPGVSEFGASVPGVNVPGVSEFGVSVPGVSVPGVSVPGVSVPGVSVPGVSEPGVNEPGVNEPGASVHGADAPGTLSQLTITLPSGVRRAWWQYRTPRARWLLPLRHGRPVATAPDVLRAPTRSDEELSLPAILVADIPMQPDRRRLLPGARLTELTTGYADFARALPPRDRLVLVPTPGFARSEADAILREALITELRTHPWLPVCATRDIAVADLADSSDLRPSGAAPDNAPDFEDLFALEEPGSPGERLATRSARGASAPEGLPDLAALFASDESEAPGSDGRLANEFAPHSDPFASDEPVYEPAAADAPCSTPTRASVFPDLTPELAVILAEITGPLVIPELSGRAGQDKLAVLDVHRLGPAAVAELSSGLERQPRWWRRFYAALEPFVVDTRTAEEFGALAVPLTDGRLVTGPRTVVLDDQLTVAVPVHWARLVHPDATHPLLGRLGARSASSDDLLTDPALRDLLEHDPADPDTVAAVLRLAPFASHGSLPDWLGLLELPNDTGELSPADELLLPGAPLAGVLAADAPFGTVADAAVAEYGEQALRAIGVGWGFAVLTDPEPTGPDHDLDDEQDWWNSLSDDPRELTAVRDLDLVDEDRWPEALRQLLSEPRTRALLADRDGYTAWWLHRHAHIDGVPLGRLHHPDDNEFDGLLPVFAAIGIEGSDLDALRPALVRPDIMSAELAEELLDALADPSKSPAPEVITRTNARLAAAVASGALDPRELDLPEQIRALSGDVVDASTAMVLDQPCFGLVVPPQRLVVGDTAHAEALATLLDLPLTSEQVSAEVLGTGRWSTWAAEPVGVVLRQLWSPQDVSGELVLHETLEVHLRGAISGTVHVPWWCEGNVTHVQVPRG